MTDQDYLKLAIEESKKAQPPHQYGAVVVIDGEIVAVDHNHVWERKDPSAHAEVSAIVGACQKIGSHNLKNATLYASHEPCVMCFSCAAWADIERIVGACQKIGSHNLKNATLYASHEPCVMCFSCAAWADIERIVYATKASELADVDDSYEFKGVSLQDLATKLLRPMLVEYVPLVDASV